MPKSKNKNRQKNPKQSYNITLDNRLKNTRFGPTKTDQEDFTKDLLDVGDSSNNIMNFGNNTTTADTKTTTTTINMTKPTISAPKFIGQKIPVRNSKGPPQNPPGGVKKVHIQSNQLLKDCLSSDIKTVVQDNIKTNVPRPLMNPFPVIPIHQQQPTPRIPIKMTLNQSNPPSGVPRSFLTRANQMVIEPQLPVPDPQPQVHYIPTYQAQYNHPISHGGMEQQTFVPITQEAPQMAANTQTFDDNTFSTRYSPTDLYSDLGDENKDDGKGAREGTTSPDLWQSGEKRVSAFDRLGPLAQPKTPKLTINLSFNKEQAVREVVDPSPPSPPPEKVYTPVHEREDVLHSTDETVMKYVGIWPWARPMTIRRTAQSLGFQKGGGNDYSPTAMMMLKEQMDELYQRDNTFFAIRVTGYPSSWTKEDVLDTMLDNLKDKPFVPCFIEFNARECKFLVIRCRAALLAIHALDFRMQKDSVQLSISISTIGLSVLQIDFIPRLILRKRLMMLYTDGNTLNLRAFTLEPDVSHFIYYPLSQLTNQVELMNLQTVVVWANLTELNLSRNRLTTIEGFDLENRVPRLRRLDLSHNRIEKATVLLSCRKLPLQWLRLEGNPLCHDYIDPMRYVGVVKMMFPMLTVLDEIPIHVHGELPATHRYFCPPDATAVVDGFLQMFIPMLEADDERVMLAHVYDERALLTITYRPRFGFESDFSYPRNLLLLSRVLLEGSREFADGRADIQKLLKRWPTFEHDPTSFSVDVMFYNESSVIFRLDGIVKLPADSLAENDQLLAFTRTIHLKTKNGVEYKIVNEMIYWDQPTEESARAAFTRTLVKKKPLVFKLEQPPDEECKKKLVEAFMKLTHLDEKCSLRCLELKGWEIKDALQYFMKLYKVDNLEPLKQPVWSVN